MKVDGEPGNCISNNYNLFLFEYLNFHIWLTLFTLQTPLVGIVSQGLVDFEIRLVDSDSHLPGGQEDFFKDKHWLEQLIIHSD